MSATATTSVRSVRRGREEHNRNGGWAGRGHLGPKPLPGSSRRGRGMGGCHPVPMLTEAPVHGHPSSGTSQFRGHPRSRTRLARSAVPQRGCQTLLPSPACAVCPASAYPPPPSARPRVRCLRLPLPDVASAPFLLPIRVLRSSPPSLPPPPQVRCFLHHRRPPSCRGGT